MTENKKLAETFQELFGPLTPDELKSYCLEVAEIRKKKKIASRNKKKNEILKSLNVEQPLSKPLPSSVAVNSNSPNPSAKPVLPITVKNPFLSKLYPRPIGRSQNRGSKIKIYPVSTPYSQLHQFKKPHLK